MVGYNAVKELTHLGSHEIIRGNETLGTILDLLKKDTTEENIIAAMRREYDAPEGAIERDVKRVIDELSNIGALE